MGQMFSIPQDPFWYQNNKEVLGTQKFRSYLLWQTSQAAAQLGRGGHHTPKLLLA